MFEQTQERRLLTALLTLIEKEMKIMATLADQINQIPNILSQLAALQTAVAALPTSGAGGTVDLSPVTNAVAAVQTTVNDIDAKLTVTPAS